MRAARWLLLITYGCLASCEQDPLRIPYRGDGAFTDAREDDASTTDYAVIPSDALFEALRPDVSYDACILIAEACNNVDDNCNGDIDEGFDKLTDHRYCENCKGCNWLLQLNAVPGCDQGTCVIANSYTGFVDQDKNVKNGCELPCTPTGLEICDGLDNDCNGKTDDGVSLPQNICNTLGPCAGAQAVCQGQAGWKCDYSSDVELLPCTIDSDCGPGNTCQGNVCPGIVINDEQKCDGIDGDCDGLVDDFWANPVLPNTLGKECDVTTSCGSEADCDTAGGSHCVNSACTPKEGICRDVGKYVCDPSTKNSVICQLVTAGQAPGKEICNNIDDNCDGTVDNLDPASDPNVEQWVTAGSVQIFKYEASRPDATNTSAGSGNTSRACSLPGRLPWNNVSQKEAAAACALVGGHLCTPSDWETACKGEGLPGNIFPYGTAFQPKTCNGRAYDDVSDALLVTDQPAGCTSAWTSGAIANMSGNLKEWTAIDNGGGNYSYQLRGGAYDTPSIDGIGLGLSCIYVLPAPETPLRLPTIGFRCCK